MPGNFLAILTRWLASHLVILTLLGFVIAGLQVFGIVDWKIELPRTQPLAGLDVVDEVAVARAQLDQAMETMEQAQSSRRDGALPTLTNGLSEVTVDRRGGAVIRELGKVFGLPKHEIHRLD